MELDFSKLSLEDKNINLDYINKRILNEICYETISKLSDENLMNELKSCKSTIIKIENLRKILNKNEIPDDKIDKIIDDYIPDLISSGTKAVIRGNLFNKIVKEYILNLNYLSNEDYEIQFEKNSSTFKTHEIPDWYILNKKSNKIIIGMNQLDLWSGGHQINRGSKYIMDFKNDDKVKMVCVICNEISFKSDKNKAYKIFEYGFKNDTICYIKNLENIIKEYFHI
jgi:hypothetical protein